MRGQVQTILHALKNGVFLIPDANVLVSGRFDEELHRFLKHADYDVPFAKDACLWDQAEHRQFDKDKKYALAIILAEQQKDARLFQIGSALKGLTDGGQIVICAENNQGGKGLLGLHEYFHIKLNNLSKNKCRLVWGEINYNKATEFACEKAFKSGDIQQRSDGLWTQPGVFSWEHSDSASLMLLKHLPELKSHIADFGCGIGELSYHTSNRCSGITDITLIDHDARAIACAKRNMSAYAGKVQYVWADIHDITINSTYDAVIMNPPFHTGKIQSNDLGLTFIKKAHAALKKGGTLYMVANIHLPYETLITELFANQQVLASENGFKVISARK